ncbi:hypothetical protein CKAH01_05587 [Colletotrichum kahawae]|uniref:Secreted protein n=1 Tax=Colletotrichum kahawae TaxID=34407 RepID=A0AAD9YE50_COLKA|nr:hypothetical protein CKAH01_05587 [Colletotrichum kahawae]
MPQVPKAPFMYLLLAVLLVDTDQEIGPQTVRTVPYLSSGTSAYRPPCTFGRPCNNHHQSLNDMVRLDHSKIVEFGLHVRMVQLAVAVCAGVRRPPVARANNCFATA